MSDQLSDLNHLKRGTAALTACVVQTLNESDPTFQERFQKKLERAYVEFRDYQKGDTLNELELLDWTRTLLTGFSFTDAEGKPFLSD